MADIAPARRRLIRRIVVAALIVGAAVAGWYAAELFEATRLEPSAPLKGASEPGAVAP